MDEADSWVTDYWDSLVRGMHDREKCDAAVWAAEVGGLLDSLQSDGFETESPLYLGYDIYTRTGGAARALADDLKSAGYVVEFLLDDLDYHRWHVILTYPNAVLVTAEVVAERWRALVPYAEAHEGALDGFSIGIQTGYGDEALRSPD